MDISDVVDLGRSALLTTLLAVAPMLLAGLAVGLIVGLIQALTQIQDQTIAFVPKVVVTIGTLSVCLPWLIELLVEYSQELITNIPKVMGLG